MFNLGTVLKRGAGYFTGQTDLLEAIVAGSLGIAAADGQIDKEEVDAIRDGAKGNEFLMKLFNEEDVDRIMNSIIAKLKANGFAAVTKELQDIAHYDEDKRHFVYLNMYKTAKADGTVDDSEKAKLAEYGEVLCITPGDRVAIEKTVDDSSITFSF